MDITIPSYRFYYTTTKKTTWLYFMINEILTALMDESNIIMTIQILKNNGIKAGFSNNRILLIIEIVLPIMKSKYSK